MQQSALKIQYLSLRVTKPWKRRKGKVAWSRLHHGIRIFSSEKLFEKIITTINYGVDVLMSNQTQFNSLSK